jgi:hypothetical protein
MDIKTIFDKIPTPNNYVVDIGASYGTDGNPMFHFVTNDEFKGLCIEGNPDKANELRQKTKFDIYNGYITPLNAIDIFKTYHVPHDLDVLKIDIDGYDLEILRVILQTYKPKIIIAEINEKIPPPICFEIKYRDDYSWDESHFFGFSIQSGANVMTNNGYKVLSIYDLNNILCINADLCQTLGIENNNDNIKQIYKDQYIDIDSRVWILPWNENVNYWLHIEDRETLKQEITNYFVYNNNRSRFEVKTKVKDVDFVIE